MRPLLALVLVLAAGCTQQERTVLAAPAAPRQEITVQGGNRSQPIVAPVYAGSRDEVWQGMVAAATVYLHHIDQADKDGGRLFIHEANAWSGDSDVEVLLTPAGDAWRVEVTATQHPGPTIYNRRRELIENYLAHLASQMRAVAASR